MKSGSVSCAKLEKAGCNCKGCGECNKAKTTQIQTTGKAKIIPKSNAIEVSTGWVNPKNKWTKMKGFRCARDNPAAFWFQEWYYVSLIKDKYTSMKECQKFCENDANCGACDHWPGTPKPAKNGKIRSFYLCDLRDQAPCDSGGSEADCSYVMILDRYRKNWVQKARACTQDCDYLGKAVRSMHYNFAGIFQGGTLPLFADSENEQYACTRHYYEMSSSSSGSQTVLSAGTAQKGTTTAPKSLGFCVEWSAKENDVFRLGKKRRESEYGTCFCFSEPKVTPWLRVPPSNNFCTQWTCSQTEVSISTHTRYATSSYYSSYGTHYYSYRQRYSSYTTDREITNCACTKASSNNLFCMEWDCQENVGLKNEYHVNWDDFDELETERYVCTGTDDSRTVNPNGRFCTSWTGNIVGRHEFELSTCSVGSKAPGGFPKTWNCHEDGWHFWKRSVKRL